VIASAGSARQLECRSGLAVSWVYPHQHVPRVQNRELSLQLHRVQKELNDAKLAEPGSLSQTLTYTQKKEKAKADDVAKAEITKLKKQQTAGAERLGRVQQENEILTKEVEKLEHTNKALKGKLVGLDDRIKSMLKSVRHPALVFARAMYRARTSAVSCATCKPATADTPSAARTHTRARSNGQVHARTGLARARDAAREGGARACGPRHDVEGAPRRARGEADSGAARAEREQARGGGGARAAGQGGGGAEGDARQGAGAGGEVGDRR
jgi:hypothetical protein